jgi:hypothetical protein
LSHLRRFFRCRSCGMVRAGDEAPFCRHGDPMMVASRMEECPDWFLDGLGIPLDVIESWA